MNYENINGIMRRLAVKRLSETLGKVLMSGP